MFTKLPELFERNFLIGYFVPVLSFLVASLFLLGEFGVLPPTLTTNLTITSEVDALIGVTVIGLLTWVVSIFLLAMNRDIVRVIEGYGGWNPARVFAGLERRHYQRLCREISRLNEEYRACHDEGQLFPPQKHARLAQLLQERVGHFPDDAQWLLPTSFGNTIRAFEVYPRVMYGVDAIPGWNRLLAVMPEAYAQLVDNEKAIVDFWVNMWLASLLCLVEYVGVALYTHTIVAPLLPPIALALLLFAYLRARSAAVEWGDMFKAAFDVFLPDLHRKFGFTGTRKPRKSNMPPGNSSARRFSTPIQTICQNGRGRSEGEDKQGQFSTDTA
ncbi:MAG: hypothetical protein HC884_03915 [Chloroflexaceae bacterium]|nr:hypothetical protein [Chloroflexaceae bacterium]